MREVIAQMLATEEEARRIVSDGEREADKLTAESRAKAVEVEESARRAVQEESARVLGEAEREARKAHDDLLAKAQSEAKGMTATAERSERAIEMVTREVLGGE